MQKGCWNNSHQFPISSCPWPRPCVFLTGQWSDVWMEAQLPAPPTSCPHQTEALSLSSLRLSCSTITVRNGCDTIGFTCESYAKYHGLSFCLFVCLF